MTSAIERSLPNIGGRAFHASQQVLIKKTTHGGYRFDLKARNGETIAQSDTYTAKASALKGIKSVRKNAKKAKLRDETRK